MLKIQKIDLYTGRKISQWSTSHKYVVPRSKTKSKASHKDMHNLFLTNRNVNERRSSLHFAKEKGPTYGRNARRRFPIHSRMGEVAGTVACMSQLYDFFPRNVYPRKFRWSGAKRSPQQTKKSVETKSYLTSKTPIIRSWKTKTKPMMSWVTEKSVSLMSRKTWFVSHVKM